MTGPLSDMRGTTSNSITATSDARAGASCRSRGGGRNTTGSSIRVRALETARVVHVAAVIVVVVDAIAAVPMIVASVLYAPSVDAGVLLRGLQQGRKLRVVVPSAPHLRQSLPKTRYERSCFFEPPSFAKTPNGAAMTGTIHVHEEARGRVVMRRAQGAHPTRRPVGGRGGRIGRGLQTTVLRAPHVLLPNRPPRQQHGTKMALDEPTLVRERGRGRSGSHRNVTGGRHKGKMRGADTKGAARGRATTPPAEMHWRQGSEYRRGTTPPAEMHRRPGSTASAESGVQHATQASTAKWDSRQARN